MNEKPMFKYHALDSFHQMLFKVAKFAILANIWVQKSKSLECLRVAFLGMCFKKFIIRIFKDAEIF